MKHFRPVFRLSIWVAMSAALATLALAKPAKMPMHLRPLDATQPMERITPTLSAPVNFESSVYKDANGGEIPYRLLRPLPDQDANQTLFPLVLVLHGLGDRGTDNVSQLRQGVADVFMDRLNRAKYPAFVVVPQCPSSAKWVDIDWSKDTHTFNPVPSEPIRMVLGLLDSLRKDLPIDGNRIYVTGMAQGGFGVWDIITRRPELFAAAVPVSGGGDDSKAAQLKGIQIRAYHGEKDYVVKPVWSSRMVEAVQKAGGTAQFTLVAGMGYEDLWRKVFDDNPATLKWLFVQSKAAATSQPASQPAGGTAGSPASQPK